MKSKLLLFFVSAFALSLIPQLALAGGEPEGFSWLVGIPGVSGGEGTGFNQYINALYALAISLAALIAVVKIVIAGAKYMMDDIVTHKSEAKQDIWNALLGLLIIIGAVIILNTINTDLTNVQVDATPATVNDDPLQFVDRFANQCSEAMSQNTQCSSITCSSFINSNVTDAWCREMCRTVYGGFMDYTGINECYFVQSVADQCDAQGSRQCCESVQGGTWNNSATSNRCGGLEAAEEVRIRQCYSGGNGTWDEAAGTCRTTDCNPNTSSQCCELGFGGSLEGGRCVTGTSELDCQNLGRVWDPATNTCAPGTVSTDETSCQARGAGFVWRAGSCIEYTNTIAVPDTFCTPPDPTCATFCIGTGGDYIPETNSCGVQR